MLSDNVNKWYEYGIPLGEDVALCPSKRSGTYEGSGVERSLDMLAEDIGRPIVVPRR